MERLAHKVVIGLGNPGTEFEGTRHNVGFDVLDRIAARERLLFETPRTLPGFGQAGPFLWARLADALLVKPTTYMNRSGEVASTLLAWAAIAPGDMLVVYDDLDLPLGTLRLRPAGGAGGHRGVSSIIESLSTNRFPRLRVGIGRPTTDAARHVLERFTGREREELDISAAEAAEAILFWLRTGDLDECMTRFHSRWNQARPGRPARPEG
jgi:PTH1 family peptidyl-tRNA hydrolase